MNILFLLITTSMFFSSKYGLGMGTIQLNIGVRLKKNRSKNGIVRLIVRGLLLSTFLDI